MNCYEFSQQFILFKKIIYKTDINRLLFVQKEELIIKMI